MGQHHLWAPANPHCFMAYSMQPASTPALLTATACPAAPWEQQFSPGKGGSTTRQFVWIRKMRHHSGGSRHPKPRSLAPTDLHRPPLARGTAGKMHSHSAHLHDLEGTKGDKPFGEVPLPKLSVTTISQWENPIPPHTSQQQQGFYSSPSARQSLPPGDPPAAGRITDTTEHLLPHCSPMLGQQQRHHPIQNTQISTLMTLRGEVPLLAPPSCYRQDLRPILLLPPS